MATEKPVEPEGSKTGLGAVNNETEGEAIVSQNNVASVKIPPFWGNRTDLWFIQVEAQFRTKGITSSNTKYDYLVGALQPETIELVADIVLNPATSNRYENLKAALVSRSTDSEARRLDALLHKIELGDFKPSELYRKMESLAASNSLVNEQLLKKLWLNKLPNYVQTCLVAIEDTHNQEELFVVADKVVDAASSSSAVIASVSQPTNLLIDAIKSLEKRLDQLEFHKNSRSRSRKRYDTKYRNTHSRSKSQGTKNNNSGPICWYHKRFGPKANKCVKPCINSTINQDNNLKN